MSLGDGALSAEVMREARALARLVLGHDAPETALHRYCESQASLPAMPRGPRALLDVMISNPKLAACIDGGLALRAPHHPVRQRLLVMLAILETEPSLANTFLPPAPLRAEVAQVLFAGVRAAFLAAVGALLLSIVAHD